MRVTIDQLPSYLQRCGLAPVFLLSGDEPMQMLEAADQIRAHARSVGAERSVLIVDKGFDWNYLAAESANLSLFSGRRLIELQMGQQLPGKPGGEALPAYADNPPADTTLFISIGKLDKRTQQGRWFKALDQAGVIIQVWPIEVTRLPDWIVQRARQMGKKIDRNAAELIAQRTEGNLLAAKQELDKLGLLISANDISLEDVQHSVIDSARYDVFALIEQALIGNGPRIAGILRGLRQEGIEPISIYGAIMWELRRICAISAQISGGTPRDKVFAEYRIWNQRQTALNAVLKRFNNRQIGQILSEAAMIDRSIKGAVKRNPWELLENFLFYIGGIKLQSPAIK